MILGDKDWLLLSSSYTCCFGLKVRDVYSLQTFVELTFCAWIILMLLNIH